MARHYLIIANEALRARAQNWIAKAPIGYRLEFKEPKRTNEQNDYMWALLTDVATQKQHCGQKYAPEIWKCIFMHALGEEMKFIPALDGQGVIPLGLKSSNLAKKEMSALIEFIISWGVQNGVKFHDIREMTA